MEPMEGWAQHGRYLGTNWISRFHNPEDETYLVLYDAFPGIKTAWDAVTFDEQLLFTVLNLGIGPAHPDSFHWHIHTFEARSLHDEPLRGRITAFDTNHRPLTLVYTNATTPRTAYKVDYGYTGLLGHSLPDSFQINIIAAGDEQGTRPFFPSQRYQIKQWRVPGEKDQVTLNPRELYAAAMAFRESQDEIPSLLGTKRQWSVFSHQVKKMMSTLREYPVGIDDETRSYDHAVRPGPAGVGEGLMHNSPVPQVKRTMSTLGEFPVGIDDGTRSYERALGRGPVGVDDGLRAGTPVPLLPGEDLYRDFRIRVDVAIQTRNPTFIQALYYTNGVPAEEMQFELNRWHRWFNETSIGGVSHFKDLSSLPPQAYQFWSNRARNLTTHDVTHLAFLLDGWIVWQTLPLVAVKGQLLIVPSNKVKAESVAMPAKPENIQLR